MAGEWDGKTERRTKPHEYEMRNIIREELRPIQKQQDEMREAQIEMEKKVSEWEMGAKLFRTFILGTVALFAALASLWEWVKEHLR